MRIGLYAIYHGREYKVAKVNDQWFKLIAAGNEPPAGFSASEYQPRTYLKTVRRDELDAVYLIKTYADFRGERLEVADTANDTVILATADEMTARRLAMSKADRCDFRLKALKSEVTRFFEESENI